MAFQRVAGRAGTHASLRDVSADALGCGGAEGLGGLMVMGCQELLDGPVRGAAQSRVPPRLICVCRHVATIWWGRGGGVDYCPLPRPRAVRGEALMGYGVIGNTTDSGSVILGSSPGTPADPLLSADPQPPSFSGLGHRPLTAAAPVRIRLGVRGSGACVTAQWSRHLCCVFPLLRHVRVMVMASAAGPARVARGPGSFVRRAPAGHFPSSRQALAPAASARLLPRR